MSVGAALSEARQNAKLTVSQLSDRTRIREAIIDGIERDDFSVCGGDFYVRGHLRAMAASLGMEPDEVVRKYEEAHGSAPPLARVTMFTADNDLPGKRGRRTPNWTVAVAVALAIVFIVAIVRFFWGSDADSGRSAVPAAVPKAAADHARAQKPASDLVVLKVAATKPAWINVRDAKGKRLFQGTLQQGKTVTWTAKERVRVVIGDAGAVRLEVNGKDIGSLGRNGQTVRRSFGVGIPSAR
jgi:cytoskeletal protein RodZ